VSAPLKESTMWLQHFVHSIYGGIMSTKKGQVVTAVAVGLITGVIRQIGESMSLFPVEEVSGVVVSI